MFISEERLIVERIKEYIKSENPSRIMYIMLGNGRVLDIDDYRKMFKAGKLIPQDAYVYIRILQARSKADFYYPFLYQYTLLSAYLLKLGFMNSAHYIVPATGLKYAAVAEVYGKYLTIELVELDTAVNNLNLPRIVSEVLSESEELVYEEEELTDEGYRKILRTFNSQKLIAGHNFNEAWKILHDYYDRDNKSLVKEVARIVIDYERIFHPYRVCYNMKKWDEVDCLSIKLD